MISDIQAVLDSTARMTGLAFSVADPDLNYFVRSGGEHFCLAFAHQQCPGLKVQCEQCDRQLLDKMLQEGAPYAIHDCTPLGLRDFFVPVRHLERPVFFIAAGAVLTERERLSTVCDRLTEAGCSLPRAKIEAAVLERLPVVEESRVRWAVEITTSVAALVEQIIKVRWERAKLALVNRIDERGRQLLGDLDSYPRNPLETMSELASAVAEALDADACCVWKQELPTGRIYSVITSGFSETQVLKLTALDKEGSLTGQGIRDGQMKIIHELRGCGEDASLSLRNLLLGMGLETLLSVPVKIGDQNSGAISVYKRESNSFSSEHIELLKELAPHVFEAISKAEFSRHSVAQAQVTRLLNVDRDSDGFYNRVAQEVRTWIGAKGCSIFFRRGDSDYFDLSGTTGVTDSSTSNAYRRGDGLTGWVLATGKALRIYDCGDSNEIAAIKADLTWTRHVVETVEEGLPKDALRSFLAVPIIVAGDICGVIRAYIASFGRPVFSNEDERLLAGVAQELGEAWKRFRLTEQVDRASRESKTILMDILALHQAIAQNAVKGRRDTREVFRLAFNRIVQHHPNWQWVNLRVPDEMEQRLDFYGLIGPGTEAALNCHFPLKRGDSLGADSYITQTESYVPDIAAQPLYKCPFHQFGARSCFTLPMIVSKKCIGLLTVDSNRLDDFDEKGKDYLRLIAAQLATALSLSHSIEAFQRADTEKRAHLEAMAHQLIAPLFALRSNCANLLSGRVTPTRLKMVITSIAAQSRIAARTASNYGILADILMERSPIKDLRKPRQNIARLVIEVARDYQPMAWENEKNITVNLKEHQEMYAHYDGRTFPQVLGNVIENAVKYSDDYTLIEVGCSQSADGGVSISVTSKGTTLLPEDVERVFERGFRGNAAKLKFPPGTGIGLSIGRAIMQAHGGKLFARASDSTGRTTFVIELPGA